MRKNHVGTTLTGCVAVVIIMAGIAFGTYKTLQAVRDSVMKSYVATQTLCGDAATDDNTSIAATADHNGSAKDYAQLG